MTSPVQSPTIRPVSTNAPPSGPEPAGLSRLPQELFDLVTQHLVGKDLVKLAMLDSTTRPRTDLSLLRARRAAFLLDSWCDPVPGSAPVGAIGGGSLRAMLRDGARHLDPARIDRAIDQVVARLAKNDWQRFQALAGDARALHGVVPDFMQRLAARLMKAECRVGMEAALLYEFSEEPYVTGVEHPLRPMVDAEKAAFRSGHHDNVSLTGLGSKYLKATGQPFQVNALCSALNMLTEDMGIGSGLSDGAVGRFLLIRALVRQLRHPNFRGSAAAPVVMKAFEAVYAAQHALRLHADEKLINLMRTYEVFEAVKRAMRPEELKVWRRYFPLT